jgi:hypothetical protein
MESGLGSDFFKVRYDVLHCATFEDDGLTFVDRISQVEGVQGTCDIECF